MTLGFEDRLIGNLTEFKRIESEAFKPGYGMDDLLVYLHERAAKNSKIMADNNAIIFDRIKPILYNPEGMSDYEADGLFALTQRLFTHGGGVDMGLALEIHLALLEHAKKKPDTDRIIKNLYCAGLIYQQLCQKVRGHVASITELKRKALSMFTEGASYKEHYCDIESKESRMYINRCLGNVYVAAIVTRRMSPKETAAEVFESMDAAISFWSDEKIRAKDPDFPWDRFISNAHQNACGFVDVLREQKDDERDIVLAGRVYDSFMELKKSYAPGNSSWYWPEVRTKYVEHLVRYFVGRITIYDLIDALKEISASLSDDDYSEEGIFGALHIPIVLLENMFSSSKITEKRYNLEKQIVVDKVLGYCRNMPSGANRQSINNYIGSATRAFSGLENFDEYIDLLLKLTIFNHLSTYVHSVTVRDLTGTLAEHFIKHRPELFVGMLGAKDVPEVHSRKREIIEIICQAALCHDLRKVAYMDMISLSSRRLYDHEFEIIKLHTDAAEISYIDNVKATCVSDVINGHHKWYNGSGGYPASFDNRASAYAFVIDMVSAADSIDAGTDIIGRSYAKVNTLDTLISEIQEGAGTRYSPIIAEALADPGLYAKLNECITEGRKEAYFEAYLNISSSGCNAIAM